MLSSTAQSPSSDSDPEPEPDPLPLSSSVRDASSMLASSGASSRMKNHQPAKAAIASTTTAPPPPISQVRLDRAIVQSPSGENSRAVSTTCQPTADFGTVQNVIALSSGNQFAARSTASPQRARSSGSPGST